MNKYKTLGIALFLICINYFNGMAQIETATIHSDIRERVNELMSKLSLEEKISLLTGTGMGDSDGGNALSNSDSPVPSSSGSTRELPFYGLPSLIMTDGPAGVRIDSVRKNEQRTYYATSFPIGASLACTWDTDLVHQVGTCIGNEALEYGSDIQLTPGMNIMRNPLCGRNYEYYSEDPVVSGKIAAALVQGIQSQGVSATPKHFVANNNETNRMSIDARISQRALREIYLRGFEIVVKEAKPKALMSSYNKVNGQYTSARKDLLTTLLRDEWGFTGMVMSDWYEGFPGIVNGDIGKDLITVQQVLAGNNLLMPGEQSQEDEIKDGLTKGEITEEDINKNVRYILQCVLTSPAAKKYPYANNPDLKAHAAISRSAAADGMVLLKNEPATLPLSPQGNKIALFGSASYTLEAGGTGSGDVNKAYTVTIRQGLLNAGYVIDTALANLYHPYVIAGLKKKQEEKAQKDNMFQHAPAIAEMPLEKEIIEQKAAANNIAIISLGRSSGEGTDRQLKNDYLLSENERNLIWNASGAFHAKEKPIIVILNIGGVIDMDSWKQDADAILLAWQPAQEGGNAIADILTGRVNPSGKLTMTFPARYENIPSAGNFPKPGENPEYIEYTDGVYVGYRYFTSFGVQPTYPFGHGLSYTQFDYSPVKVEDITSGGEKAVSLKVKNTGSVAGKEVVQLYVASPAVSVDKPVKELKAFAKTRLLQPGEEEEVRFLLSVADLASFVPEMSAWVADAGTYTLEIGASSEDIKEVATFTLPENRVVEKVHNILNLQQPISELKKER